MKARVAAERVNEELDWLAEVSASHPRRVIPEWALEAAAYRLGYSPGHVRRLVLARVGRRRDRPWEVEAWLLPLWFAHGNLTALHRDLLETRAELAASGSLVPLELEVVPESFVTFWRAFQRTPHRYQEFLKRGTNGSRSRMVCLRWQAEARNEIWQADCCKLDIWVVPRRGSKPVRPWLIVFIDDRTRLIMAATMCLSQPSAEETAATCARALRLKSSPDRGVVYGGRPQRVLWDNGGEFKAKLMTTLCTEVGFAGTATMRHTPSHKGKVERFFGTFQRWVLMSLPGYSKGPRLQDGTPVFLGDPADLLSDEDLWSHLAERVDYFNWRRPHSALGGQTPGDVWAHEPTALIEVDASSLRVAVLRSPRLTVANADGVAFRSTKYLSIDAAYSDWIGERVEIGFLPHDGSFIELFRPNGDWLCTAYEQSHFGADELYGILNRRQGQIDEIEQAALEAKALRVQRASSIRSGGGAAGGLVATSLARREGRVADTTAPPPQPTLAPDEAWLQASRDALDGADGS